MDNNNNNKASLLAQAPEIDFGRIFRLILMQSKMIIAISAIGFFAGLSLYYFSDKIYKVKTSLQVFSMQSSTLGPGGSGVDLVLGSSNNYDINNLIYLYKTRSNLIKIINDLKLNITIEDLENNEKLEIESLSFKEDQEDLPKILYIGRKDDEHIIYDFNKEPIANISPSSSYKNDNFQISIGKISLNDDALVRINYQYPYQLFNYYRSAIQIRSSIDSSNWWRSGGIIEVTIDTNDYELGKKILDNANYIFLERNIELEKEKASKAIGFIDQRLVSTEEILNINKDLLKDFQQQNTSLDVDLEIQSIINSISQIESNINQLEIELAKAENTYTKDSPFYSNLKNQQNALIIQKREIETKIRNLPIAQQKLIDLYRDVDISQELYSELLNKKLAYSIMEASTLGNIRIIDNAYVDTLVGPTLLIIIISSLISFLFAIGTAIFRGFFMLPITNPAEIPDNMIDTPIVSVIPFNKDINNRDSDERFLQSIESLFVNISTLETNKNLPANGRATTILVTSPTPANGKSFVSSSLAKKLSELGKKVLVIDFDLKRGVQHKLFSKETIREKEFFSITNFDKYLISENLYLIPKIKGLKSSFQFITDPKLQKAIEEFKDNFDYIIFDTAPILSVSDTSYVMGYSDINFLISMHSVTKLSEIKQTMHLCEQTGYDIDGIIYNSYERPSSYYGYYGLYGNYNYQYYAQKYLYNTYDYDK